MISLKPHPNSNWKCTKLATDPKCSFSKNDSFKMTKKTSKLNPPTCSQLQCLMHRNRYLVELFCQGNPLEQDFCFLFKLN